MFYFATGLGWLLGSILAAHLLSFHVSYFSNAHGALAFLFYTLAMLPLIFCVPKAINSQNRLISEKSINSRLRAALLDIRSSLQYLRATMDIRILMRMLAFVLILGMPFTHLLSIYAHDHQAVHQSSKFFSHLFAALSAGNLLGAFIGILVTKSALKQASLFAYVIFGFCLSAIAALLLNQYWEIVAMILLVGLFTSLSTNLLKGLIQSQSEEDMRGRIAGFTQLLAGLSTTSAGLAGFAVHHLSNHETNTYVAYETVQLVLIGLLAVFTLLSLPSILKSRISI